MENNENKKIIHPFDVYDKSLYDAIKSIRINENNKVDYMGLCIYLSRLEYNELPFLKN